MHAYFWLSFIIWDRDFITLSIVYGHYTAIIQQNVNFVFNPYWQTRKNMYSRQVKVVSLVKRYERNSWFDFSSGRIKSDKMKNILALTTGNVV